MGLNNGKRYGEEDKAKRQDLVRSKLLHNKSYQNVSRSTIAKHMADGSTEAGEER